MHEESIKTLLTEKGASLVGFCRLDGNVCGDFPKLGYAVSIIYKLSSTVIDTIKGKPSIIYFQHYRAVNARLDSLALDAVSFIENAGYSAIPIAASQSTAEDKSAYRGVFPHKTAAVLSGLGFIGKSGLLLTREYGSEVRLCTVLTDMPIESDREIIENGCGDCRMCAEMCPAHAIKGEAYINGAPRDSVIDAAKCSAHMKTYNDIGRGSVCGICISVCPYNKRVNGR